jgi:hypothetical protein
MAWAAVGQAAYSPYGVPGPGMQGAVSPGLAPTTPDAASRISSTATVLVLVGGAVMALGTLFAWETANSPGNYIVADAKGTSEGAGPVLLIAGLVVALLGVLVLSGTIPRRKTGIATLVISALSLAAVLANASTISNDINKIKNSQTGVTANIGIGLIFSVIGCAVAIVASIGLIRNKAKKAKTA